jgi:uncharacterized protein (TIGR02611 family)
VQTWTPEADYRDVMTSSSEEVPPDPESRLHQVEEAIESAAEEFVEGFQETVDRVLPPHLRARAWARRRRSTTVLWQAGVLLLGFGLVLAGVAMLVLPGPGWASIILGLIVLASEYAWARRLLDPVRRWAQRAAQAALDPRARRRNLLILSSAVVMGAGLAVWYVAVHGMTLQPVLGLLPG